MGIVIVDGIRSPFGNFGGALKEMSPVSLGTKVLKGLLEKVKLDPAEIDDIIIGNVIQTEPDSIYLARHVGLNAGMKASVPALTVNRLCGSGMEAVIQGYYSILTGRSKTVIAGGVENMSRSPYLVMGARWGNRLGNNELVDMLHTGLTDAYVNMSMGLTAENLATEYKIAREAQDEWARRSQSRAEAARNNGILAEEILPMRVRTDKGRGEIKEDETIRGTAVSEKIAQLPPAFRSDGTVTAGNSSGLNDGASMLLMMDEDTAKAKGLKPLARVRGFGITGCDPKLMGLGPVHAIPMALKMAGLELKDMGLIEVNEAFAAQILAVVQDLNLNPEITNVNGGAIAIGHPLGASGNRLLLTMAKEMKRRNTEFGVASLCIGGGQGIATVIENLP